MSLFHRRPRCKAINYSYWGWLKSKYTRFIIITYDTSLKPDPQGFASHLHLFRRTYAYIYRQTQANWLQGFVETTYVFLGKKKRKKKAWEQVAVADAFPHQGELQKPRGKYGQNPIVFILVYVVPGGGNWIRKKVEMK